MKKRIVLMTTLLLSFVSGSLFAQSLTTTAPNGTFTAESIEYWIGQGSNEIGLILHYDDDSKDVDCFVLGYRYSDASTTLEEALTEIANSDDRFSMDASSGFLNDFAFDYDGDGTYEYTANGDYFALKCNCSFTSGMSSYVLQSNTWISIELNAWSNCLAQNATYTAISAPNGSSTSGDTSAYQITDSNIVAWVKGAEVVRDSTVTNGHYYDVIGVANTSKFVAINQGNATLTFDRPIKNGSGVDFVVFGYENGSNGQAFVEVSSNGVDFFRFDNKTKVLQNGYGTGYDLDSLTDNTLLNKQNIRLIRIVDDSIGGMNLAGVAIYNAGTQYSVATFENLLTTSDSYEIVNSTNGTLAGQDEYGMDMYEKDYVDGGLTFKGVSLYDGMFSIGWGPSNLTTASGYYASACGAALEGVGNGYLQGYFSDYAGTTEHLTVMASDSSSFAPQGTYICQCAASYSDASTLTTNDNLPGWMKIVAVGYNNNGDSVASASVYLVDKNTNGVGNVKEWRWLDMSSFGAVKKVKFRMESNYANNYGLLISAYFCMDNFVYTSAGEEPIDTCQTVTVTLNESICQGDTFMFNNKSLTTAGTYVDTLQTINGCDSVITLNLTVNPTYDITLSESINESQTFDFNGKTLSVAGTYMDTLQTINGCDSIITLNLTIVSGLEDLSISDITMYPNPTSDRLYVTLNNSLGATISIIDFQGRKVKEYNLSANQNEIVIDTEDLSEGTYMLMVKDSQTQITKKIIKR